VIFRFVKEISKVEGEHGEIVDSVDSGIDFSEDELKVVNESFSRRCL
jgi:hypothetical protein